MNAQRNEWGQLIDRQLEISQLRDMQEAQRQALEREAFKHSLDHQSQLKQMQRMQDSQFRQQELQDMQQRTFLAAREEKRQRQRELNFKKELAKEYTQHQENLRMQQIAERQRRQAEEQARVQELLRAEEQERRRQREVKRKLQEEQEQIKQFKAQQDAIRRSQEMNDKRYEAELIEQNRRREEVKERNHRAYFHKLNDHQQKQAHLYNKAIIPTNERALNLANWVDRNFYKQQAALAEKEERERQVREANRRSLSEALQSQVKDNERKKFQERLNQFNEIHEVNKRLEFSKKLEEEKHSARMRQMNQYKSELETQISMNNSLKMPGGHLSEVERKLNRQMLDPAPLHVGATQVVRSLDAHKSFIDNAQKFYDAPARSRSFTPAQVDYSFEKVNRTMPLQFSGQVRPAGRPHNLSLFY